jgi:asparagine synthase (glutamine-hydrolysing)
MGASIAHRGPDGADTYADEAAGIGLVHRRLAIIDLSPGGHQPMIDESARAVISYNGEVYNYRELRQELVEAGYKFRGHSDTEVILNLYLRHGVDMIQRLNGIYAFAIWDRARGELLLARDALGVKPLYYASTRAGIVFASEIKALLQEPTVPREIEPAAVARHLTFLWSPAPTSILKGVLKLEPGCAMIVRNGAIARAWRFYDLPFGQPKIAPTVEEARRGLRAALDRAVERQMVSDVPVGAFLSGGLDSSAVVASARRFSTGRLECFTIEIEDRGAVLSEGMSDDLPYARRVAQHLDVDLDVVKVGPEIISHLPLMLWHLDEPQADPAALNAYFISELARSKGIKVLLSGAGGDDILTGYRRHHALALERYWKWLPHPVRAMGAGLTRQLPASSVAARRLGKAFAYAGLEGDARIASYLFWMDPEGAADLLNPDFSRGLSETAIAAPMQSALASMPTGASDLDRLLHLDCRYFLADHNLNYTDRMSMAHGVEARVPLLDVDLVAYAASLPDDLKQRGRIGKWIFKKAMEGVLPDDIIYRPKTGFGAPLRYWLRHDLRDMVGDLLSADSIRRRGIFDAAAVERLIALDRAGRVDAAYPIFAILCIELWACIFLDNGAARPSQLSL